MSIRARLITLAIAGLLAMGAASCGKSGVQAARDNGTDLTDQKILSMDAREFLLGAEKAEITERSLAQEALQISKNPEVREFARQVISDRGEALSELKHLMETEHIAEPAALGAEIQTEAETRLHRLSSGAFDHEFASLMTADLQEAVANFNSAAETAADPDIRKYAARFLPSLQTDYHGAADLEKKLALNTRR